MRAYQDTPRSGLAGRYLASYSSKPPQLYSYEALDAPAPEVLSDNQSAVKEQELPSKWSGVIGVEGTLTGDSRLIEKGSLEWSTPIPLRVVLEDIGAHDGAVAIGRILEIERRENGLIYASGDFDLGSEVGREAARLVRDEILTGISMDLDSVAFEVRIAADLEEDLNRAEEQVDEVELERSEDGQLIVARMSPNDEIMVTTSARIRAATLVSIPAFAEASITAIDFEGDSKTLSDAGSMVASAAPVNPPRKWFDDPQLSGATPLTITDEGQVYGHLATWDSCHIGEPSGSGVCVMAPKSKSNYAYFHTGAVKTAEGDIIPTGMIRFDTGHASLRANAADATAHYDNTGTAGADIRVGEDSHGIWVAGALRPQLTEEQVRTLQASPLSGDWRYIQNSLELVGALAVNLPGFPIPRTSGLVASGEVSSIVAAGVISRRQSSAAQALADDPSLDYLRKLGKELFDSEIAELKLRKDRASMLMSMREISRRLDSRKRGTRRYGL